MSILTLLASSFIHPPAKKAQILDSLLLKTSWGHWIFWGFCIIFFMYMRNEIGPRMEICDMVHASCICIFTSIKYTNCTTTASITYAEAVTQRSSVKTVFLEISQNSHKSTCARVSFLNKVAGGAACNFIKKRDSGTGAFLWILPNFWEQLFYRTPPGDCFYLCPRLCVVLIVFSFFFLVISFIVCHVRFSLCNMSFSARKEKRGFLISLGDVEMEHWREMGQ